MHDAVLQTQDGVVGKIRIRAIVRERDIGRSDVAVRQHEQTVAPPPERRVAADGGIGDAQGTGNGSDRSTLTIRDVAGEQTALDQAVRSVNIRRVEQQARTKSYGLVFFQARAPQDDRHTRPVVDPTSTICFASRYVRVDEDQTGVVQIGDAAAVKVGTRLVYP